MKVPKFCNEQPVLENQNATFPEQEPLTVSIDFLNMFYCFNSCKIPQIIAMVNLFISIVIVCIYLI